MSQQPTQKPSLGRVVHFQWSGPRALDSKPFAPNEVYAADIVRVDEVEQQLVLHVKTADPERPIQVVTVPFEPDCFGATHCLWRWPPRV